MAKPHKSSVADIWFVAGEDVGLDRLHNQKMNFSGQMGQLARSYGVCGDGNPISSNMGNIFWIIIKTSLITSIWKSLESFTLTGARTFDTI